LTTDYFQLVSGVRVTWKAENKRFLSRGLGSCENPLERESLTVGPAEEHR
jgi:hypothetical protein